MTTVQIVSSCGHHVTSEVDFGGAVKEASGRTVYTGRHPCPACCASQPVSPVQRSIDGVSGSVYQVAWALDIRMQHWLQFEAMIQDYPEGKGHQMRDAMRTLMASQTSARWWIAHKDNTFLPFVPICPSSIRRVVIRAAYQSPHSR